MNEYLFIFYASTEYSYGFYATKLFTWGIRFMIQCSEQIFLFSFLM